MTLELFLSVVFKVGTAIAFTAFAFALTSACVYYSWKMAEGLIKKRRRYIGRLKKSHAFKAFNGDAKIAVVPKKNGKAAAK